MLQLQLSAAAYAVIVGKAIDVARLSRGPVVTRLARGAGVPDRGSTSPLSLSAAPPLPGYRPAVQLPTTQMTPHTLPPLRRRDGARSARVRHSPGQAVGAWPSKRSVLTLDGTGRHTTTRQG